jgi:hypothetical protein
VSASESELAHQKFIAGKQDYDEGNYDSAIRRFRDAYTLDCTKHELLVMISQAYEKKGDKQEALAALEAFVARSPSAPDLATYQTRIENLKKAIEASTPPPAPPPPPEEPSEHTIWPWVTVGAGVVAAGVGIALLATAEYPKDCDASTGKCNPVPGEDPQAVVDRSEEAGNVHGRVIGGIASTIGGGVLVVGGLVWHFLEPSWLKDSTSKASLRPSVAPGFAGMSFGGSF